MVKKTGCFEAWAAHSQGGEIMETGRASWASDGGDRLFPDPHHYPPGWPPLHKPIMMVMGRLVSAVGELVFLLGGGGYYGAEFWW